MTNMNIWESYKVACEEISRLKATRSVSEWENYPTEHILCFCTTLPQIERICKHAKQRYLDSLNLPGRADNPNKVFQIMNASNIYYNATVHRKKLIKELEGWREIKKRSLQSIQDLMSKMNKPEDKKKNSEPSEPRYLIEYHLTSVKPGSKLWFKKGSSLVIVAENESQAIEKFWLKLKKLGYAQAENMFCIKSISRIVKDERKTK